MIHSIAGRYGRDQWHPPFLLGVIALMLATVIAFVARANAQSPPRPVRDLQFAAPICPPRGLTVDAEVIRIIDADTIVVSTSIEYQVRLLDCWAPESRTKDLEQKQRGLVAKARMQQLLSAGTPVRVHVPNGSSDLTEAITMGRLLGRVWPMKNGLPAAEDLSTTMVREGLATIEKVKVKK